jgi:AraC-like DNA-binding protein
MKHDSAAPLAAIEARRILFQLSARRPVPEWLGAAYDYLASETSPSVFAASRHAGVSREHLSRAFTQAFGVRPKDMQRCVRLSRAASALSSAAAPAAHLAVELGYSDQSHMIREFRAAFGMTPGEFAHGRMSQSSNPQPEVRG